MGVGKEAHNKWNRAYYSRTRILKGQSFRVLMLDCSRATQLIKGARQRAKEKGLPFSLRVRAIQAKIDRGICEVSGLPLNLEGGRTWDSPSIDRIVPELGYTPDNTRVVCFAVNSAMGDWGLDKLLEITDAIKEKQRS